MLKRNGGAITLKEEINISKKRKTLQASYLDILILNIFIYR